MVWGYIIAAVASLVGSAYYQKKMTEDMKSEGGGIFVNKTGASEGLRIIYGRRRVGAIKVWKGVTRDGLKLNSTSGYDLLVNETAKDAAHGGTRSSNDWLHRLDVWAQGEIDGIENFHIDGDEHTHTRFTGNSHPHFRSVSYYGSQSQTAPADLVSGHSEITSSMSGKGVAYSWNRFLFRESDIQYQGEPSLTATVRGLKVWNPATHPNDSSIKSWSNNPALCLLDYLMADYGKGLSEDDLDIQSFIDAAAACDTTVSVPSAYVNNTGSTVTSYNPTTGELYDIPDGDEYIEYRPYQTGTNSNQKRFQCDLVLEPKDTTAANVEKILKCMKGTLPFSQGIYKLVLEDSAVSVKSFDESNILGNLDISFADRSKRLNRVTIKFPNRNKDFEEDIIAYPDKSSLQYSNWYSEDQSEDLHQEIKLEGVTDYYQAEDLAEFIVKDSRTQMFIGFKAQPEAMSLESGDIISLTHASPNWTNKEFRIREITINSDLTVNVKAQEYDSNIYQWGVKDAEPHSPYQYIDPFKTPDAVTNLAATETNETKADGTIISGLSVTWDDIVNDNNSVDRIFVGYKPTPNLEYIWSTLPRGETSWNITGLNDNTAYTVAVYYKDIIGKQSDIVSTNISIGTQTSIIGSIEHDISQVENDVLQVQTDAATAISNAATAQSAADAAQTDADAAQVAADAAQADANTNATDVAQALSDAASAASAAANAQSTADLKQSSAEVLAAIAADTTVIDGSRITTGTIDAARLNISGKNISDLNNDSGFTNDDAANTAAASAATAAGAAAAAQSAANAAQADADAAQADVDALPADIQAAQDAADAAQLAADAAQSTADTKQTSAEVLAAIAADTTVIDGARITTGTIAAGRIDIAGKNISDLTNDSGFTNDDLAQEALDAADNAQDTADAKQTAAQVLTAIQNDTTVIDGARITTGTVNSNRLDTNTLAVKKFDNVSTKIIDHAGNEVPLRTSESAFYRKSTNFTGVEDQTGNYCTLTVPNVRSNATYNVTFSGVLGNNTGIYVEYSLNGSTWTQASGGIQNITMSVGTFRSYTFMYSGQITGMTSTQTSVQWRVRFQTYHRSTYLSLYVDMDNTT